ncbi:hypothetical protein [Kitasatospora sp. McL0602]|uniref:hypothetical protein n=1 Tax=Kitasatospora sp. McL0602 TaxID=3439530 RepID=UPI003F8A17CD
MSRCGRGGRPGPAFNAVIRAHLRAQAAGAVLHVANPTARVAVLFRRTGLDQVLRVSPDAALPAVEEPACQPCTPR